MKFDFHTFVLDVETTGLDPKRHQLLSVGGVLLDPELREIDAIELFVGHEEYTVQLDALVVNKIDLHQHRQHPELAGRAETAERLQRFFQKYSGTRIMLAGWNVSFDHDWFYTNFVRNMDWPFITRRGGGATGTRLLDIQSLAVAVEGIAKPVLSSKLQHTALSDARDEANYFRELMEIIKK